eukprot:12904513-Prorocentrum_lima.AAC.1
MGPPPGGGGKRAADECPREKYQAGFPRLAYRVKEGPQEACDFTGLQNHSQAFKIIECVVCVCGVCGAWCVRGA